MIISTYLPKTGKIKDHCGPLRTTEDHWGLLRITEDHRGSPRITEDHRRTLRIAEYDYGYLVMTLDASGLLWMPPNDSGKEGKVEIQGFFVWSIKNMQMNRVKPMYARERGPLAHELVVCYKGVSMGGWIPCQPLWGKYLFSATLQPKPASASFLKKKTKTWIFPRRLAFDSKECQLQNVYSRVRNLCYYSGNQLWGGVTNRDMLLNETC